MKPLHSCLVDKNNERMAAIDQFPFRYHSISNTTDVVLMMPNKDGTECMASKDQDECFAM